MTDNITPIAPIARCAGCGAEVRHEQRFDPTKHGDECPQPEIRMRRAEARIAQLQEILTQLVGQGNETVTNQVDLNKRLLEAKGQIEAMRGVINQYSELVMRLSHSLDMAVDNAGKLQDLVKLQGEHLNLHTERLDAYSKRIKQLEALDGL